MLEAYSLAGVVEMCFRAAPLPLFVTTQSSCKTLKAGVAARFERTATPFNAIHHCGGGGRSWETPTVTFTRPLTVCLSGLPRPTTLASHRKPLWAPDTLGECQAPTGEGELTFARHLGWRALCPPTAPKVGERKKRTVTLGVRFMWISMNASRLSSLPTIAVSPYLFKR